VSKPVPDPSAEVTAPPSGALVSFGDAVVASEIADESGEWGRGLMHREHLAPDAGMIFLFPVPRPGTSGFYMKNTLIPLSIAYMRRTGASRFEVVAILDMEPCPAETITCPTYPPGEGYDAALEVNQGWFEEAGVAVGAEAAVEE
jgi:hypothetical protein